MGSAVSGCRHAGFHHPSASVPEHDYLGALRNSGLRGRRSMAADSRVIGIVRIMGAARPTGHVAFLFTDIEDSTRLWERDREGMASSLVLHDHIMRSAIGAHRGLVFSTAGDAFAAAFQTIDDAVAAAIEIQRSLLVADWVGPPIRVRMGIHAGEAEERDGDYFGPVLNRTARIMSAGNGGQILVSSVAAKAAPAELHDLGTHHLRDLDHPEHVFEIRHPDLPVVERAIRTVDVRRHNLPDYLTSFVGRGAELAALRSELETNRLVVLTGVGGTGKTRLAVECARSVSGGIPDGAWLVELAPVTNPQLIMTAIGDALGVRAGERASIEDAVISYLWERSLLLVIDNCEHVLNGAAAAIKLLLDSCPNLTVLATSRELLGIPGETDVPIPSLELPDPSRPGEGAESVQLFLERARSARPDWQPSDEDMEAVARICTRIDGIPLGLELAAARLRTLSTTDLAVKLDESFRILSRSSRTALPRQRTLQATIDWSHDLLDPDERTLFLRLAMFLGGFDLEAAQAVCPGGDVDQWDVLDLLESLVDKSLVIAAHDRYHGTRFRLLEPVRQYAQEKLVARGESEAIARAHAHHYSDLVARLSPLTRGPEQQSAEWRLNIEVDNIRGAFDALLEIGDIERHLTMGFDLFAHHQHTGMQIEGCDTLRAGIRAAPEDIDRWTLLKALHVVAVFGAQIGDVGGVAYGRKGLELADALGHPSAVGRAHLALAAGMTFVMPGPESREHLRRARELLEAHPEPSWWEPRWDEAIIQMMLGTNTPREDPRKSEHLDRAIALFEEVGDAAMLAASLDSTAGLWNLADNDRIMANMRRAVSLLRSIEAPYWLGHALQNLGHVLLNFRDEAGEAAELLSEARVLLDDCGDIHCWAGTSRVLSQAETALGEFHDPAKRIVQVIDRLPLLADVEMHIPWTLDDCARVLMVAGHNERAAIALGKALDVPLASEQFVPREQVEEWTRRPLVERLGDAELDRLLAEGAAMNTDEALQTFRGWLLEVAHR